MSGVIPSHFVTDFYPLWFLMNRVLDVSVVTFINLLFDAWRVCVLFKQASRLGEVIKIIPQFVFYN